MDPLYGHDYNPPFSGSGPDGLAWLSAVNRVLHPIWRWHFIVLPLCPGFWLLQDQQAAHGLVKIFIGSAVPIVVIIVSVPLAQLVRIVRDLLTERNLIVRCVNLQVFQICLNGIIQPQHRIRPLRDLKRYDTKDVSENVSFFQASNHAIAAFVSGTFLIRKI